jgi:hypothetical protein
MAHDNAKVLKDGFAKGLKMIEDTLYKSLSDVAEKLLVRVASNRQFTGFTGNTQTSYACGVYVNGKLISVIFQHNWDVPTRRMKVRKGQVVYLAEPYEGGARAVKGQVDIVENHGKPLSIRQIEEYRAPRHGIALMMTTGTEYSTFIEEVLGKDVLTRTFIDAERVLKQSWKTLPVR